MKILVAGCGSIGRRHVRLLRERKDVEVGAFDISAQARAAIRGISADVAFFDDLGRGLSWKPDIVLVATPNDSHRDVALAAFRCGCHVLCEKPLADTVEDGRKMVEAARRNRRILAVGYSLRYRTSVQFVEKLAGSGKMGTLVGGRAMVGTYRTLLCARTDFRSRVFGVLVYDYTHLYDMLRAVFGEVKKVCCAASRLGNRPLRAAPSLAVTTLVYRSGAVASAHMDYIQHPQRASLEIYGDALTAVLDLQADTPDIFDWRKEGFRRVPFHSQYDDPYRAEHQDMIEAVRRKRKPKVTGLDGLRVLEIAEKAVRQIR